MNNLQKGRATYNGKEVKVYYKGQTIYDARYNNGELASIDSNDWESVIDECEDRK